MIESVFLLLTTIIMSAAYILGYRAGYTGYSKWLFEEDKRGLYMPTGRTCGNCENFTRIKIFSKSTKYRRSIGKRGGICDIFDYNCYVDSSYAKRCKEYKAKRYERPNKINITTLE